MKRDLFQRLDAVERRLAESKSHELPRDSIALGLPGFYAALNHKGEEESVVLSRLVQMGAQDPVGYVCALRDVFKSTVSFVDSASRR